MTFEQFLTEDSIKAGKESEVVIKDMTTHDGTEISSEEILGLVVSSESEEEMIEKSYEKFGNTAFSEEDISTLKKYWNDYSAEQKEEEKEEEEADGMIRDEIKFSKFIKRLRSAFQEILVKPLYIQMCLKYPEFENDPQFRTQIALRFNEENMFAELKTMEIMERRLDFISTMRDNLMVTDPETMEEDYFFDLDFLVDKYLKLSPDDKAANDAYKARANEDAAGEDDAEGDDMGF